MLELIVLVNILINKPIFEKIEVPKEYIQAYYQIDDGDKYERKCMVALNHKITDNSINLYNKAVLFTNESCKSIRKRFYNR